jgi:thymidylate synthase (FAD)
MSIEKIGTQRNIFGDNIAFVEKWDFSQANTSEENRVFAITQVASICYQSPKALGSETLYNRLMAESMGLPSSSFEFVPVLLDRDNPKHKELLQKEYSNVKKFGELVEDGKYLLTNYRAIVYDFENDKAGYSFDIRQIFNTLEEAEIIRKHFHVFLYKVDLPTRSQMVRHRVNWQELSRRYVSGK